MCHIRAFWQVTLKRNRKNVDEIKKEEDNLPSVRDKRHYFCNRKVTKSLPTSGHCMQSLSLFPSFLSVQTLISPQLTVNRNKLSPNGDHPTRLTLSLWAVSLTKSASALELLRNRCEEKRGQALIPQPLRCPLLVEKPRGGVLWVSSHTVSSSEKGGLV